jgi:hypothetical protein
MAKNPKNVEPAPENAPAAVSPVPQVAQTASNVDAANDQAQTATKADSSEGPLHKLEEFLKGYGRSLEQGAVVAAIDWIQHLVTHLDIATQTNQQAAVAVSRLHAFAVGEKVEGPKRGYAEDVEDVIKELRYKASEQKSNYEGACKLVAAMHAAAVGEVTGPKRGVVEDVEDVVNGLRRRVAELEGGAPQSASVQAALQEGPPEEDYLLGQTDGQLSEPQGGGAVEIAYNNFRVGREGDYPNWGDLAESVRELYRIAFLHVSEGGEPRTNYECEVKLLLGFTR